MYDSTRQPGSKVAQMGMLRQGHDSRKATDAQGHPIVLRVESQVSGGVDLFDRNFFNIRCPSKITE
jgi:hypothetical protein